MIINEYQMFGNFIEENEKLFEADPDAYVVPISMEIIHELLGHAKLRYSKEVEFSPLVLRDSKSDFKIQKLIKK